MFIDTPVEEKPTFAFTAKVVFSIHDVLKEKFSEIETHSLTKSKPSKILFQSVSKGEIETLLSIKEKKQSSN
jgi:hypothetical protein